MTKCERCTVEIDEALLDISFSKPVKYSRGSGTVDHLKERICDHVHRRPTDQPCLLKILGRF